MAPAAMLRAPGGCGRRVRVDRAFMCELHRMARQRSIGRRYRQRPNTKVSWTMVGSLTHAVGVRVSRGMPPIRSEKCTMSEQTRIARQLDPNGDARTRALAEPTDPPVAD